MGVGNLKSRLVKEEEGSGKWGVTKGMSFHRCGFEKGVIKITVKPLYRDTIYTDILGNKDATIFPKK